MQHNAACRGIHRFEPILLSLLQLYDLYRSQGNAISSCSGVGRPGQATHSRDGG